MVFYDGVVDALYRTEKSRVIRKKVRCIYKSVGTIS